jgi:hypothetical protein
MFSPTLENITFALSIEVVIMTPKKAVALFGRGLTVLTRKSNVF